MKHRIFAALTALALLPTGGCGITQRDHMGATLEVDLSKSYACEELSLRGGSVAPVCTVNAGAIVAKYFPQKPPNYLLYSTETGEFQEFPRKRTESIGYAGQLPDGRYIFLYNDSVGRESGADVGDGVHRSAEIFDQELHLTESFSLPEEVPVGYLTYSSITMDSAGNWLFFSNNDIQMNNRFYSGETSDDWVTGYYVLNPDFTVKGELTFDGYQADELCVGSSGKLYGIAGRVSSGARELYRFDCAACTSECLEGAVPYDIRSLMSGTNGYELYFSVEDGIYGMKEDGTSELVVDFANSDLPDGVWTSYSLPDGTFLVNAYDEDSGTSGYVRLRPRTEEELAGTEIISLAGVNINRRLVVDAVQFNRSQNDYRIVIKDYGKEWAQTVEDPDIRGELQNAAWEWRNANVDYTPAIESFKNDLLSGTVPDIVCMDGVPYQLLSNKGILTDLYPMLTADERFDESKYLRNILGGLKRGERLERIGFSFSVDTMAAKMEFVGERQWHTADEYLAMLQSVPEGMQYLPVNSREELTERFLVSAQGTFIDKASMTCRFDSQAFVSLLELVGAVQPAERLYTGDQDYWDAMEYGYNYAENHTLLHPYQIVRPVQYHSLHMQDFGKADITLVGFPESAGGNGGMYRMDYTIALTAQSNRTAPVLDFIMTQLSSQRQAKLCIETWHSASLPLMTEMMENSLLGATRGYHDGGNLTTAEMDVLRDYIEGVRMYQDIDPSVTAVIQEEAGRYFAGDVTAQDAANAIQSRVAIYLAEQK